MKIKIIVLSIFTVCAAAYSCIKTNSQKNTDMALLLTENVEALANSEISMDFCLVVQDVCIIYSDGLAIKGYLQYSVTV